MKKEFDLHQVAGAEHIKYFYKREKRDVNGNSRFRVWIIGNFIVEEQFFKCYESQIPELIKRYVNKGGKAK